MWLSCRPERKDNMTIDIDFEVYKALTLLRPSEDVTYNDVLRQILKLDANICENNPVVSSSPVEIKPLEPKPIETKQVAVPCRDWIVGKVIFPEGTRFRAKYQGRIREGIVKDGVLEVDGIPYASPSGAAVAVTGSRWNGWRFWECQFPGRHRWVSLSTLRKA